MLAAPVAMPASAVGGVKDGGRNGAGPAGGVKKHEEARGNKDKLARNSSKAVKAARDGEDVAGEAPVGAGVGAGHGDEGLEPLYALSMHAVSASAKEREKAAKDAHKRDRHPRDATHTAEPTTTRHPPPAASPPAAPELPQDPPSPPVRTALTLAVMLMGEGVCGRALDRA